MEERILVDAPEVLVRLTFAEDGAPIVHVDVHKHSKSLYKWLRKGVEDLLITLGVFGYPALFSVIPKDDKVLKFNKLMGFEMLDETPTEYRLVQWV